MRNAFSDALVAAARADQRILLLTGDHGYSLFDDFRQCCPNQYFNCGVAEQNMVGVAAGLAKGGFLPVVYGLSAFVPMRVLEQIKLDVCYEQLPVVFIGDGAGVVYSTLGTSHQCTEDLGALRCMPHMSILSPADGAEMTACMSLAMEFGGPTYLRMGKADLGTVHAAVPALSWGGLLQIRPANAGIGWLATGSMVLTAVRAAQSFPGGGVWSVPSIKPIDQRAIAEICRSCDAVVTLEEHSVYGGLGSAVAEIAAAVAPAWILRIGVQDRFSQFCGDYQYLRQEHRLAESDVVSQVQGFLNETARLARPTTRGPYRTAA